MASTTFKLKKNEKNEEDIKGGGWKKGKPDITDVITGKVERLQLHEIFLALPDATKLDIYLFNFDLLNWQNHYKIEHLLHLCIYLQSPIFIPT